MLHLAIYILIIMLLGIEFCIYGVGTRRLFGLKMYGYETIILGFFVYFGLFQIVALPLILLQRPFHELAAAWLVIALAVNIFMLAFCRDIMWNLIRNMFAGLWRAKGILLAAVVLLVCFVCWFQGTQQYIAGWWDTAHYVGTVNTTVHTDTMYLYDGASGLIEKAMNFRYALSAFYIHSAVLCKWTSLGGIMIQKYVMGSVCALMHALVIFSMGRRLFHQENQKALFMTAMVFLLQLGFHNELLCSGSDFLLLRGYEAKGFCANVVIPAVFYALICLWQGRERKEHWILMFAVCFSSVAISMSAILIVPAMAVIAALAEWMANRSWKVLWRGLLCILPNALYLAGYFLFTRGIFRIVVHG